MQRKVIFLLILISSILVGYNTVAQEIKVFSGVNDSPLPFATVTNHSHPLIVFSDMNGVVHLSGSIGDTLSISYIGYKTARLVLNGDKIQVVRLLPSQK
ncbi:MAG: hypothetical protein ACRDEB_00805, partial [Chitinophagaceae bacterium]